MYYHIITFLCVMFPEFFGVSTVVDQIDDLSLNCIRVVSVLYSCTILISLFFSFNYTLSPSLQIFFFTAQNVAILVINIWPVG